MPRTLRLFAPPKRVIGPLVLVFVLLGIVLPLVISTGWVLAQFVISRTTSTEFCTACHSMAPMAESYRIDVHGGRSIHGVQAACSDCHLPRDDATNFIWVYWKRLVGDAWVELFHGSTATDWEGLRGLRETYVYDSGCLGCHANLLGAFPRNSDAFAAHRSYFKEQTQKQCVSCHSSAGHKDLGSYLPKGG
jgi:cytochrome c-type protein NapC